MKRREEAGGARQSHPYYAPRSPGDAGAPDLLSAALLAQAFLEAPIASLLQSADGTIVSANAALAELLGLDAERLPGTSLFALAHLEDRTPSVWPVVAGAERRYLHSSGAAVLLREATTTLAADKEVSSGYVVLQLQAVSRNPEEGRGRADRLQLLDQIPVIVWTTDTELRFTSGIARRVDLLHLGPEEAIGSSLYDYFRTRDPDFVAIASHQRSLAGESMSFEFEWLGRAFRN